VQRMSLDLKMIETTVTSFPCNFEILQILTSPTV